jgi:predicted DCC family thiol-disulfide oxidoreductase YuxK
MDTSTVTSTSAQHSELISDNPEDIWVVYDQECPFCSRYVLLYQLREQGRQVHLINARSDHPLVAAVRLLKLDLNEGMVVRWRGQYHYGSEAMHLLALLGRHKTIFNRINQAIFAKPAVARLLYPWLVRGRKLTLRLLGRKLISEP